MTDTVIVRFEGDGSGVAELSRGQHEIWYVVRDKAFLYISDTPDVPCYESRADNHFVSPAGMAALGDTAEGATRAVPAIGTVR